MVKSRMGTKSVILHSLSCELLLGYLEYGQRVLNVLKKRIGVVLILVKSVMSLESRIMV